MTERARYWSDLVTTWERNGLSQAEFCRRRGINGGTFVWWKRQLQKQAGELPKRRGRPPKVSSRFVEVRLERFPDQRTMFGRQNTKFMAFLANLIVH